MNRLSMVMVTLVMASIALAEPATQPAEVTFRFHPQPGQSTTQRVVSQSVGSIQLPPPLPEMKFSQTYEQDIISTCEKVNPDKSAVLKMALGRIAMKMNSGGVNFNFDSESFDPEKVDNPVLRLMGQVYASLTGASVKVTFDATGHPVRIDGLKAVLDKAIREITEKAKGEGAMGAMLTSVMEQIGTSFDDESMTEQMMSYYRMIPKDKKAARVGETWTSDWELNIPVFNAACHGHGEYELLGVERIHGRPCAKIGIKESFRMASSTSQPAQGKKATASGPLAAMLDQMEWELAASEGEGLAYFDYEAGELVQLRSVQRITIKATMPNPPSDGETKNTQTRPAFGPIIQKFQTSVKIDLIEPDKKPS